MDYSQLSDREIDYRVLEEIYGNQAKDKDIMRAWTRGEFKYTTNPADAWPIIVDNRIGIIPAPEAGKWRAAHREVGKDNTPHHFRQNDNPLRAAMIVFLMMQGAKHA